MSRKSSKYDKGKITPEMRRQIIARDKGKCAVCQHIKGQKKKDHYKLDVHHIVEKSRGGSGEDPGNLVTLCHSCHLDKIHTRGDLETIVAVYDYMIDLYQDEQGKWSYVPGSGAGYDYNAEKEKAIWRRERRQL